MHPSLSSFMVAWEMVPSSEWPSLFPSIGGSWIATKYHLNSFLNLHLLKHQCLFKSPCQLKISLGAPKKVNRARQLVIWELKLRANRARSIIIPSTKMLINLSNSFTAYPSAKYSRFVFSRMCLLTDATFEKSTNKKQTLPSRAQIRWQWWQPNKIK